MIRSASGPSPGGGCASACEMVLSLGKPARLVTEGEGTEADKAAYLRWREQGMNRDVMRVRLRKAMRGLQGAQRG